jgi:rRNA-processing protein FCF1
MKKTFYVLDTSALIQYPDIIERIKKRHTVVIPSAVMRELDGLKKSKNQEVAERAILASKWIEYEQSRGRKIRIEDGFVPVNALSSEADNQVLGCAKWLKEQGNRVILVTTDRNERVVAESHRVECATRKPPISLWDNIPYYVFAGFYIGTALFAVFSNFFWAPRNHFARSIILDIVLGTIGILLIGGIIWGIYKTVRERRREILEPGDVTTATSGSSSSVANLWILCLDKDSDKLI